MIATLERNVYSIGFLAERYGVSTESLRNWEREELIPPSMRTPGGHRRYTDEHLAAIDRLLIAQSPHALNPPCLVAAR